MDVSYKWSCSPGISSSKVYRYETSKNLPFIRAVLFNSLNQTFEKQIVPMDGALEFRIPLVSRQRYQDIGSNSSQELVHEHMS